MGSKVKDFYEPFVCPDALELLCPLTLMKQDLRQEFTLQEETKSVDMFIPVVECHEELSYKTQGVFQHQRLSEDSSWKSETTFLKLESYFASKS